MKFFKNNTESKRNNCFFSLLQLTLILILLIYNCTNLYAGEGIRKEVNTVFFQNQNDVIETRTVNGSVVTFIKSKGLIQNATYSNAYISNGETRKKIRNIISLVLKEETQSQLPEDFTVSLNFSIKTRAIGASTFQNPENKSLTVSYNNNKGRKYQPRDYIVLNDLEEVEITIQSSINWSSSSFNPFAFVTLENSMEIERFFELQTNAAIKSSSYSLNEVPSNLPNISADAAILSWDWQNDPLNTHTQIEWTWVEDAALSYYNLNTNSTSLQKAKLFLNNATRIDVDYNFKTHKIPLLYGGKGKLYARIRPVSYDIKGNRTDGNWSEVIELAPSTHADFLNEANVDKKYNGHEPALNWQVTTTFSEEGKSKTVINYFDGSLRSRQTVTKDNEQNKIVTAETMYDLQGRPAIQILPTPGIDNILRYQKDLNKFNGQSNLDDPALAFDLASNIVPLNSISGSARYYSPNNSSNNFIPDAQGYPFSITRYTPDATGRIQEQTGVGINHKLGSGHTTKYYYTKPTQQELDGLFGVEAGNQNHYSKNMVMDANGQVSVSYVDMRGKTIATALAGKEPDNLAPLAGSQSAKQITTDLIGESNNIQKNNNLLESVTSVSTSDLNTEYVFNYNLNSEKFSTNSCNNDPYCMDVIYDIEFSITKDDEEDPSVQPLKVKFSNKFNNPTIQSCSTSVSEFKFISSNSNLIRNITPFSSASSNNISFSITFQEIGTYTIRKSLVINEEILQKYANDYAANSICKSLQTLIDEQFTLITTATGCATKNPNTLDCASCNANLGADFNAFKAKVYPNGYPNDILNDLDAKAKLDIQLQKTYEIEKARCNKLCNDLSPALPTIRELMLSDMKPYTGQYALTQNPSINNTNSAAYFKYNILHQPTTPSTTKPFYKYPLNPNCSTATCTNDFYYTTLGIKDGNAHNINPNSTAIPKNTFLQDMSVQQFDIAYQQSWLNSLLPYHPEYKKLIFAEKYLDHSYNWQNKLNNTNSWSEAVTNGFITSSTTLPGLNYANSIDKLFVASVAQPAIAPPSITIFDDLYNKVNANYSGGYSLWQLAYSKVLCADALDTNTCIRLMPKNPIVATGIYATTNLSTVQKNEIWDAFKAIYLTEREKILNNFINNQPNNNHNECILISQEMDNADPAIQKPAYLLRFPISVNQQTSQSGMGTWLNSNGTALTTTVTNPINQTPQQITENDKETTCSGYIQTWKNQLLNCPTLSDHTQKDLIITTICNRMKEVCKNGYDANNPNGSSTVNPSTPATVTDRSFEQIITEVFATYNISISNLCNPFVIEAPKPFGKNPSFYSTVVTKLDSCHCTQYQAILSQVPFTVNKNNLDSLNKYFISQYGQSISVTLFNALKKCPNANANYIIEQNNSNNNIDSALHQPTELPEFLKCDYDPNKFCLSCGQMVALTNSFKQYFANTNWVVAPIFNDNELDELKLEANILFSKYINFKTGLQFSWLQFAQAANKVCDLDTPKAYQQNNKVICASPAPLTTANVEPNDPCKGYMQYAVNRAQQIFDFEYTTKLKEFETAYRQKAFLAKNNERFTATYSNNEYHFTLYYYDQAGNLVKTVPPSGVQDNRSNTTFLNAVAVYRILPVGIAPTPNHTLTTNYYYNSLNQVVTQKTPDAGTSNFWYDNLGRLVLSQNAKQATINSYSYTQYDNLGRITQVGQIKNATNNNINQAFTQNPLSLNNFIDDATNTKTQITITVYDNEFDNILCNANPSIICQKNLRNRVSYTLVLPNAANTSQIAAATYYTYDIHGNVDKLVQDMGVSALGSAMSQPNGAIQNRWKTMAYDYDLISGKVNKVSYQQGYIDQFYHKYNYDAENRLISTSTSLDDVYWEQDASYTYYQHGPLQRVELGKMKVQGIDYAYTLQGWLKGVNTSQVATQQTFNYDMGQDGAANSVLPNDVFGFTLNYYQNDYIPIGFGKPNVKNPFAAAPNQLATLPNDNVAVGKNLFNGNIASMLVNIPTLQGTALLYGYQYDQLNRIVAMNAHNIAFSNNNTTLTATPTQEYKERVTYDPNGNILTYLRNGNATRLAMDNFTYNYYANTNQLNHVQDNAPDAAASEYDKYNDIKNGQTNQNYQYDEIGNLIYDRSEGINNIDWTVYGKIAQITKQNGTTIKYGYDASGNRISKIVAPPAPAQPTHTYYVRDASGNVMSIYEKKPNIANNNLLQTELHLYGSSRLGVLKTARNVQTTGIVAPVNGQLTGNYTRGSKLFELSNHLGNVLVTITDKKIQIPNSTAQVGSTIQGYLADIATAQDYYPFGMAMPGRSQHTIVQGGSVNGGTTNVGGVIYPNTLIVSTRLGNTPTEYKAYQSIEFVGEYTDNGIDNYLAFIVDENTSPGNGNITAADQTDYRYGFNGKENDKDISEGGQDFTGRIYDGRLGRWLSIDPLQAKYPMFSPYHSFENNPIVIIDPTGNGGELGNFRVVKGANGNEHHADLTFNVFLVGREGQSGISKVDIQNHLNTYLLNNTQFDFSEHYPVAGRVLREGDPSEYHLHIKLNFQVVDEKEAMGCIQTEQNAANNYFYVINGNNRMNGGEVVAVGENQGVITTGILSFPNLTTEFKKEIFIKYMLHELIHTANAQFPNLTPQFNSQGALIARNPDLSGFCNSHSSVAGLYDKGEIMDDNCTELLEYQNIFKVNISQHTINGLAFGQSGGDKLKLNRQGQASFKMNGQSKITLGVVSNKYLTNAEAEKVDDKTAGKPE